MYTSVRAHKSMSMSCHLTNNIIIRSFQDCMGKLTLISLLLPSVNDLLQSHKYNVNTMGSASIALWLRCLHTVPEAALQLTAVKTLTSKLVLFWLLWRHLLSESVPCTSNGQPCTETRWGSRCDLQLLSQCGRAHNCLSKSVSKIHLHFAGILSKQHTNTYSGQSKLSSKYKGWHIWVKQDWKQKLKCCL